MSSRKGREVNIFQTGSTEGHTEDSRSLARFGIQEPFEQGYFVRSRVKDRSFAGEQRKIRSLERLAQKDSIQVEMVRQRTFSEEVIKQKPEPSTHQHKRNRKPRVLARINRGDIL